MQRNLQRSLRSPVTLLAMFIANLSDLLKIDQAIADALNLLPLALQRSLIARITMQESDRRRMRLFQPGQLSENLEIHLIDHSAQMKLAEEANFEPSKSTSSVSWIHTSSSRYACQDPITQHAVMLTRATWLLGRMTDNDTNFWQNIYTMQVTTFMHYFCGQLKLRSHFSQISSRTSSQTYS